MIRKKTVFCLTFIFMALLSSFPYLPNNASSSFYVSFMADKDKLVTLKTESILLSPVEELYVNIFDYLKEGDAILSLDIEEDSKIRETIKGINSEIENLTLNINLNESTMVIYESQLRQADPSAVMAQYEVTNVENQLKLARYNQAVMEEALHDARLRLVTAENTLKQDRVVCSSLSGYLMDMVLEWSDDGVLLIGELLPKDGVYLRLNGNADSSKFSDGQKLEVYMFDRWISMIVSKSDAGVRLDFEGDASEILQDIQFTYPIIVQIR